MKSTIAVLVAVLGFAATVAWAGDDMPRTPSQQSAVGARRRHRRRRAHAASHAGARRTARPAGQARGEAAARRRARDLRLPDARLPRLIRSAATGTPVAKRRHDTALGIRRTARADARADDADAPAHADLRSGRAAVRLGLGRRGLRVPVGLHGRHDLFRRCPQARHRRDVARVRGARAHGLPVPDRAARPALHRHRGDRRERPPAGDHRHGDLPARGAGAGAAGIADAALQPAAAGHPADVRAVHAGEPVGDAARAAPRLARADDRKHAAVGGRAVRGRADDVRRDRARHRHRGAVRSDRRLRPAGLAVPVDARPGARRGRHRLGWRAGPGVRASRAGGCAPRSQSR